jgi:hypothetical protein
MSEKEFAEVCRALKEYYVTNPAKEQIITLPEIFGKKYSETAISTWLAYLLDPQKTMKLSYTFTLREQKIKK